MTQDLKRRLVTACDVLRAERAGLETIVEHLDRHPIGKFRLQEARVICALAKVIELRALALCDDKAVRG